MPQPPAKQFSGIFVSYRRDDSSGHAGRLSDRLVEHFGKDRIFMDIDTIEPGEDFVTVIENAVGSCEILIAIIGRNWLSGTGDTGRLDNPNDFVRLEIGTALRRDIRVIPVLVQRASMPKPQDLPEDLAKFTRRNAIELSDLRWQSDVDQLIGVMERVLAKREAAVLAEAERQSEAERQRGDDEKKRLAAEQVRLAGEEANERVATQRRREEKELERREAEERARRETQEAARLRAEEERAQAEAEARDRKSIPAAADEELDEPATKITAVDASTPAHKNRRVALIAGATLVVLVVAGAAVLIWRTQRNRDSSGDGNQTAAVAQPSTASQPSPAKSSGTPALTKPGQTAGEVVQNQMGIDLVYVPAGSFMMGSNKNIGTDEKPVHQVMFKDGFYMGKHEVTQAQWQAVMGNNPSHFKNCGGNCPVEQVSWEDAQSFINRLNAGNDRFMYRLPTEAEWEYACRAGTKGSYAGNLSQMAWYADNSGGQTRAVGGKQPNAWGLTDMHGNVWEWCQDTYHENYDGAPTDGSAWLGGGGPKVLRGGSWSDFDMDVRSAIRENKNNLALNQREGIIGFRLVAVVRTQ